MKRTARDILKEKGGHMVTISSEATVYQAVKIMTQNRVGSIVVVDEGRIVGIWTERDLMYRAIDDSFNPKTEIIGQSMTRTLISANVDDQAFQLYDKFLGRRIRHLLIEENGEYIGILSVGDVMRANLQQRAEEYRDLNEMVSLEYYENWKVQHDGALR
ncbi:MAG: CBS domain-containing protein [Gammaproteobacteria bacterium]|nr:CBS domain-containing protein [Gammaproteobacteria bacterium]MDP2140317.1 CBS domain-containing protein [Gammaproteobacteria bacterium]MDP2346165.1 CBS domain-containing protein [Gammaproteobacteria bacterium]